MKALAVRGLEVAYGDHAAVRGASLELERGLLALVGESGCGKTSLLRAIAGFERPRAGVIEIGGQVVVDGSTFVAPERRSVGMVFQEGALFPHLTVWENVRYGVRGSRSGEGRARELLERVGLAAAAERFPDELSGGQQQRVALARALAPEPRLLLLDEPFAGLDPGLREQVRDRMREVIAATDTSAVLVTHDREEALTVADQVAVMVEGEVLQVAPPGTVYARPESAAVARFMGSGELIDCRVDGGRFRCVVGEGRCDAADGAGRLLLRPEDVSLRLARGGEAVSGLLESRQFYGHDALDSVRLNDGSLLKARVLTGDTLPVGARVAVRLRERLYRVFADEASGDDG